MTHVDFLKWVEGAFERKKMRVNLGTGSYFRGGWGFDDMLFTMMVDEMAMEDGAMELDSSPSQVPIKLIRFCRRG